jgi:hypothetical protein
LAPSAGASNCNGIKTFNGEREKGFHMAWSNLVAAQVVLVAAKAKTCSGGGQIMQEWGMQTSI